MRKEVISEIRQMQKLMIYNLAKTDTENTQLFEQEIHGTPPDGSGGGSGGSGGGRSRSLLPIPSELANSAGVKKFQDWLVSNNFGSELGRFGADSKFGNFTKAAWDKHKSEYLSGSSISGDDIIDVDDIQGQASVQTDIDDIQGQTTQQPAGQTTQTSVSQTTVQTSLDGDIPQGTPTKPSQDELPT
jgi:hypothetical protein